MTKRLDITEAQVRAICNGASKANEPHIPVVQIGNAVVRLIPASMAPENVTIDTKGKGYL
ncbi:hypothetical protein [Pseudochrobactrum saccharolyticum]|uniref:hypothetical protein n=1 Tax=Pseudochrobactrum saccharolyticum TaxID=354352 RepID=UPI0027442B4D|nr:hypothetical protein [Pseudochrobactrum saccharolyticum]MDP8249955.1 hypothetical protein [Pseudochrobactrum saccharolyticum]